MRTGRSLIDYLLAQTDNPAALALAADLQASDYTTRLAEIAMHSPGWASHIGAWRPHAGHPRQSAGRTVLRRYPHHFGARPGRRRTESQREFDAEITGDTTGAVSEDSEEPAGGDLDITDGDWGEDAFQGISEQDLQKEYGAFSFDEATGKWSFTVDNEKAQSLKEGHQIEQTLTVKSTARQPRRLPNHGDGHERCA